MTVRVGTGVGVGVGVDVGVDVDVGVGVGTDVDLTSIGVLDGTGMYANATSSTSDGPIAAKIVPNTTIARTDKRTHFITFFTRSPSLNLAHQQMPMDQIMVSHRRDTSGDSLPVFLRHGTVNDT